MPSRKMVSLMALMFAIVGIIALQKRGKLADGKKGKVEPVPMRQAWTTSRLRGTPDPPPPYQARRRFPHLQFKEPVLLAAVPGTDRLIVAELEGKVFTFPAKDDCQKKDLFIDLRAALPHMHNLLSLTFHPKFATNRYCFICYVAKDNTPDGTRVSRFKVADSDPPRLLPETETVMLTWLSGGHNGCCLAFGPDGFLYISTGDATAPSPPDGLDTGQNLDDLLSCILRIDIDRPSKDKPYTIPADNPFIKTPGGRGEIWAYGFRNPWRMSFDPKKGDLWVGDVGWELWEMIYRVERGGNYGWSIMEGPQTVRPNAKPGPTPIQPPIAAHMHTEAASITGGYVYRGQKLPDLKGAYIYGDFETGKIWGLRHDGHKLTWQRELADTRLRIISFGEDRHGELYFLSFRGDGDGIFQLEPTPASANDAFPRQLSATGLFAATAEHRLATGVYPFSINAEAWMDHAHAERFLALPERATIQVKDNREIFPKDSVLGKTISLEMKHGDPKSRRRIETQILHFDGVKWLGYSYLWNDDQTDATLVEAAGVERTFTITDAEVPDGRRQQTWRVPSRTMCAICHNPTCQYRLAFRLPQLAKAHVYEDGEYPQLLRLQQLELLTFEPNFKLTERYVDPHDRQADLTRRARSYLHVNCAHCHQSGGGGTATIDLRHEVSLAETKTIGARPVQGNFGIPQAEIVSPGNPFRSVLFYRMAKLGAGRMPHIGSTVVDRRGLALMDRWIRQAVLPVDEPPALTQLLGPKLAKKDTPILIYQLLTNPSDALALGRSIDERRLPKEIQEAVLARASTHANPQIRDLFERFLPEEKRSKRLGNNVDALSILALKGDVRRGEQVFWATPGLACANCHKIGERGKDIGPELSHIGKTQTAAEILESILQPSKKIDLKYLTHAVTLDDGRVQSGMLLQKTEKEIILADAQGTTHRIPLRAVEAMRPQTVSLMPEGSVRDLTAQQLADLLAYLSSRK